MLEHGCTVHRDPSGNGPVSGGGVEPWGKGVKEVVGTREYGTGGDTDGGAEGRGGGGRGRHIDDRYQDMTLKRGDK